MPEGVIGFNQLREQCNHELWLSLALMIIRDFRLCMKDFFPPETLLSLFLPKTSCGLWYLKMCQLQRSRPSARIPGLLS